MDIEIANRRSWPPRAPRGFVQPSRDDCVGRDASRFWDDASRSVSEVSPAVQPFERAERLRTALAQAWAADCHQVLLQSGRADRRVHRFYEQLGFVPGRRTAYVALRPLKTC